MDEPRFWQIIDDRLDSSDGDQGEQLKAIERQLSKLKRSELIAFQQIFDQKMAEAYTWRLWGAAYLINGGCSDDGFAYFRAWLISQGEKIYKDAIENPDTLAAGVDSERDDYEFEEVWERARDIKRHKTGNEMPKHSASWPATPRGERWNFDDDDAMAQRLPTLSRLYA